MKLLDKLIGKKEESNAEYMPRRNVKILSIKNEKGDIDFNYDFGFSFITEDNKKKAVVWINEEKVTLDKGQFCVFILESGDIDPFRLKITPDFKSEGCHTTSCFDPSIKDSDI